MILDKLLKKKKICVPVVRFDVLDPRVPQRSWMAESDPPLATIRPASAILRVFSLTTDSSRPVS